MDKNWTKHKVAYFDDLHICFLFTISVQVRPAATGSHFLPSTAKPPFGGAKNPCMPGHTGTRGIFLDHVLADTLTLFQSSGGILCPFSKVCPGVFRELPERLKKQHSLHCSAVWCSGMAVVVIFASRIRRGRVTDEGELIAVPG